FPLLAAILAQWAGSSSVCACDGLADGPSGIVVAVPDGNTVKLDSGLAVRLIGTRAPMPAGSRPGAQAEPLAAEARAGLAALVLGKTVRLGLDAEESDRYGNMEAELFLAGPAGTWVEPAPVNRRCIDELLAAEAPARAAGLGIWADPYYSVRNANDPESLAELAGRYELAEGKVVSVGATPKRDYLDFGRVWKDDVTATIGAKALRLFS